MRFLAAAITRLSSSALHSGMKERVLAQWLLRAVGTGMQPKAVTKEWELVGQT